MLDQLSKEELKVLKDKLYEAMQELRSRVVNKEEELRQNLETVRRLENLTDKMRASLEEAKIQVAKNLNAEEEDPRLKMREDWNIAVRGTINLRNKFQEQYEEAQESYKTFLSQGNRVTDEWRQAQSKYKQKYALYIKLSIYLAQRATESDDSVSNGNAEEGPQTSYSGMKFS